MTADPNRADPAADADPAVTLLRATFEEHAADAPPASALTADVRRRATAGRRRWTALLVAAAVAVVATGTGLVLAGRPGTVSTGTSVASPTTTPARPGWKRVSSLGVQVDVPQTWGVVGAIAGCEPLSAAGPLVVRGGGAVAGCGYTEPPGFTVVVITTETARRAAPAPLAVEPGTTPTTQPLDRIPMDLTTSRLADGRTELVLASIDRDVAVVARGPAAGPLQDVLLTVALVDVDDAGCASVLPTRPGWDRPDRAGGVDPGEPDAVSVCSYSSDDSGRGGAARLAGSALLEGGTASSLLETLRAARPGPAPDAPSTECLATVRERASVVLLLHRGSSVTPVRVHYDRCRDRYVASPDGVAHVTEDLLAAIYGPLGTGWGTMSLP